MTLRGCPRPLCTAYDLGLVDLDGVVYRGPAPIPHAADALAGARRAGMRLAFVTNNASRTAHDVAAQVDGLGVACRPDEVVTSAQAAAAHLRDLLPAGAPVLVVGGEGLRTAVVDAGLRPVTSADDGPAAVVQGYARDVGYPVLAEAALAIRAGARWVATNLDATLPTDRGELPGNGALVAALRVATGREPVAVGKPEQALYDEAVRRAGGTRPLAVGDRLDTDVASAVRAGYDSLLVLTGVADAVALLGAPTGCRPSYVAADLRGLLHPHPEPVADGDAVRCGRWRARVDAAGRIELDGRTAAGGGGRDDVTGPGGPGGGHDRDGLDGLRAAAVAAWRAADAGVTVTGPVPAGALTATARH